MQAIFEDFGFLNCARSMPVDRVTALTQREQIPHIVEGTGSVNVPGFRDGVPGYKQFHFDVPAGAAGVEISWRMQGAAGGIGGIGGGQPGPAVALDIALRKGELVTLEYMGGTTINADARFTPELTNSVQRVVLSGDCLPVEGGRVHLLPLNTSADQMQILTMGARVLEAVEGETETCSAE